MQCAAVRTQSGAMSVPPHCVDVSTLLPVRKIAATKGYRKGGLTACPPMMRGRTAPGAAIAATRKPPSLFLWIAGCGARRSRHMRHAPWTWRGHTPSQLLILQEVDSVAKCCWSGVTACLPAKATFFCSFFSIL